MKPTKVIARREQSAPARCGYVYDDCVKAWRCGALMVLVLKEPKWWSYQERVSERCLFGHIAPGQGVLL